MSDVDISGLDKGAVLAALYNASRPLGMGFMQYDPTPMTPEKGALLIQKQTAFDYLFGRVMKVDLVGDSFSPYSYDRDNGDGQAARVIQALREGTSDPLTAQLHHEGVKNSLEEVSRNLDKPTTYSKENGVAVVNLGLSDVAEELAPKLEAARQQLQ